MKNQFRFLVAMLFSCNSLLVAHAQDEATEQNQVEVAEPEFGEPELEEVITIGRALSSSRRVVQERLNDSAVVDMLSSEDIEQLGDSTVAAALIRVPGVSLVNNKFVYIRGLGERYSSSLLNGSRVPSPDLTRNVIPLDIFPTSIVEDLRIQKAYSTDMPANFGGGLVDVRTRGIPNDFVYSLEFGSGNNSFNDGSVMSYAGGSDDDYGTDDGSRALSQNLLDEIVRFQGDVDVQSILNTLVREGNTDATVADAQQLNRELGLMLNRQVGLEEKSAHPDIKTKGSVGKNFIINQDWEVGALAGASYETGWREDESLSRNFNFPDERTDSKRRSTRNVDISGNLNMGIRFTDDHELSTTTLYLRNTDDETTIRDFFNENREVSDGIGFRNYKFQFEERDMVVNQIQGSHRFGVTTQELLPEVLSWTRNLIPNDAELNWFYSDARARTSIPNEVSIAAQTVTEPVSGEVLSSSVDVDATAADFRFTDLEDDVINHGWSVNLPYYFNNSTLDIGFGYEHDQKARTYRQSQFSLGALDVADPDSLGQPLDQVFSDANILSSANNYVFDIQGTNNQSYLAATMVDAYYGFADWNLREKWRIAAGLRWEDYRQVALDWNPFGYSADDPVLTTDVDTLERGTFQDDQVFPSLAVTYMGDLWAETFQLRLAYAETTVRPDLREITDASYIDPITDDLVDGNPGVVPADIGHFDLRAEWFFGNGDNFTATLFYKDIDNPIEFFESAASDTTIAREIVNAESAEVYGIEIEGLKALGNFGTFFEPFFIRGNVTIQDSELVAGDQADAPTNAVRSLAGASDYVANLTLGFDSHSAKHSAAVGYNVFGERLYVAGRNGAPDGFEQPFHSLDFSYSWYPTDRSTVKVKVRNMLDERIEIERLGINTFTQEIGTSYSVSFQWGM